MYVRSISLWQPMHVFRYSVCCFCPILNTNGAERHISKKLPSMMLHENVLSGFRYVTSGHTDGYGEGNNPLLAHSPTREKRLVASSWLSIRPSVRLY